MIWEYLNYYSLLKQPLRLLFFPLLRADNIFATGMPCGAGLLSVGRKGMPEFQLLPAGGGRHSADKSVFNPEEKENKSPEPPGPHWNV